MRTRIILTVSVVALVAAACTQNTSTNPAETAMPSETLFVGTGAGPLLVRIPTGSVLFEHQGAVGSLGGSFVVSPSQGKGATRLRTVDATGGFVGSTRVDGTMDVGIVSESGRDLALVDPPPAGWDPSVPVPRARTTIVIADPRGVPAPMTYDLRGNYEPEAFSTDDRSLFLIQHLPAESPTVYRVTVLDLRRGKVYPVFGPYKTPSERMPGIRLQQVLSPGGDQLYTLYSSARPGYAPHHAPVTPDATVSFVHVLNLQEGWAHCVGLPKMLWDRPASEQALAPSPNGRLLYVVNAALGVVSVMDTDSLAILRTEEIGRTLGGVTSTAAVVSDDGASLYLGAAGQVERIDTDSLTVADVWATGDVTGLGLSADGKRLYVAVGEDVKVLDAGTGAELGTVAVPSPAPIDRLWTPAA
jgi:hypothetical protein